MAMVLQTLCLVGINEAAIAATELEISGTLRRFSGKYMSVCLN